MEKEGKEEFHNTNNHTAQDKANMAIPVYVTIERFQESRLF
jgi:hypothetical protein